MGRIGRVSILFLVVSVILGALAAPAFAATSEFRIFLDLDNDATTGCSVTTVDGAFDGVEQILITTVVTGAVTGEVTAVERQICSNPATDTFTPPTPLPPPPATPWAVGLGLGTNGSDVVETLFPLNGLTPQEVRLAVEATSGRDADALLDTNGDGTGNPIILVLAAIFEIPTLSPPMFLALVLLLALLGFGLLRHPSMRTLGVVLVLLAGAGSAWAACVLDGQISDWVGEAPLALDPVDAAPGVEIHALFGKEDGGDFCFRIDVDLVFNEPPTAVDDAFTVDEDSSNNSLAVLTNDSDPENDALTITAVGTPDQGGTATTDGSTISYTPAADFKGTETFTYTIQDTAGNTAMATVTVTVNDVNDPPTALDDSFMVEEDSTDNPLDVLANDSILPDMMETLTITAVGAPDQGGAVSITGGGTALAYTPAADFKGTETFTYSIADGRGGTDSATVTVTVTNLNDDPTALDDNFMVDEDSTDNSLDVLANDSALPDMMETLTISAVGMPDQGGTAVTNDGSTVTYTPAPNFAGVETFTYTIIDGNGGTSMATVTVTVNDANADPPVCGADAATTDEDTATLVDVLANDSDPDPGQTATLTVLSVDTTGTTGTVTNNGTDVTYDPNGQFEALGAGDMATDTFSYTARDSTNRTCMATVTVTITGVDDPATVTRDFYRTVGNTLLEVSASRVQPLPSIFVTGSVLTNDSDPDDPLSVVGTSNVTAGAVVSMNADGTFTYVPPPGLHGDGNPTLADDTFNYQLSGGEVGEVGIDIDGFVWYVDNRANGGVANTGTGTSTDRFSTLADAESSSIAGDFVYVFEGDGTNTNYDDGFGMKNNQKLLGQGVDLVVDVNGTPTTLFTGNTANKPLLQPAAGVAVAFNNSAGEVAGLDIRGGNGVTVVPGGGSPVIIRDNAITGLNSLTGLLVDHDNAGTLDLSVLRNTIGGARGVDVTNTQGTLNLVFDGNTGLESTDGGATAAASFIEAGGVLAITSFNGNAVSGTTATAGLVFDGVVFDTAPGDGDFTGDEVAGGNTAVGSGADPVPGSALVMTNVSGDIAFGTLNLFTDGAGAVGLDVTGNGVLNAGAGTGFEITNTGGTISSANGPAVILDPLTAGLTFGSVTGSSSTVGISLTDVAGTFAATGGSLSTTGVGSGPTFRVDGGSVMASYGGTVSSAVGNSVVVQNMTGGNVTVSGLVDDDGAGISMTGNNAATSLTFSGGLDLDTTTNTAFTATGDGSATVSASLNNNAVNTTTGTALLVNGVDLISAFNTIGVSAGSGVGISIQSSAGSKGLGVVSIVNTNGQGLLASNAGTVSLTGGTSSINTTNRPAVDIDNTTFNGTFASLTSNDSTSTGIDLQSVGGSFVATTVAIDDTTGAGVLLSNNTGSVAINGGTIGETTNSGTTTGGNALDVDQGAATVTVAAAITNTAGRSVEVTNRSGGTVTVSGAINDTGIGINVASNTAGSTVFSNASKVVNTGANGAVNLTTNTGHTVQFTNGGLDVDTTSGAGFRATGGGTVEVAGANNTVNTTTGTGVEINGTDIGAGDVTFRSVSVNGATNGIVLNGTGTSGDFVVTGDGSNSRNGTGGTIQNTTSHGVTLTSAQDVTLVSVDISNPGSAAGDQHGISAIDLSGSSNLIRGCRFSGVADPTGDAIRVRNTSTNLGLFEVNDSLFTGVNGTGNDGVLFDMKGTSVGRVDIVNGSHFDGIRGDGVQVLADDDSTVTANISGSRFSNDSGIQTGGVGGLSASRLSLRAADGSLPQTSGGDLTATVTGNVFDDTGVQSGALPVGLVGVVDVLGDQFASITATISGNTIQDIEEDGAIRIIADDNSSGTYLVDGNTVGNVLEPAVFFQARDSAGLTHLTIQNNNFGGGADGQPGGGDDTPVGSDSANFHEDTVRILVQDSAGTSNIKLLNNTLVNNSSSQALDVDVEDNALVNLTVHDNLLTNLGANGEAMDIEADNGGDICLDLNGDNVAANRNTFQQGTATPEAEGVIDLMNDGGTFQIEDLAGGTNAAAVDTFLTARNDFNNDLLVEDGGLSFSSVAQCSEPALP